MALKFRGIDVAHPQNRLLAGFVAMCQNVRSILKSAFGMRTGLSGALFQYAAAVASIQRLNDSTPNGPELGYAIIGVDVNGVLYCGNTQIATGLNVPLSMIANRPDASVQPWMYIFSNAPDGQVTISTRFAIDGTTTTFICGGTLKVRSDGLVYKAGIKEPQQAPTVSTPGTTTTGTDSLPATTIPWTNVGGANSSYNYGHTSGGDGTSPVVIALPSGSQTLKLVVTGTATVNGASHAPGDTGPTGSTFPANFTGAGPKIVLGAFTDGSGNVLTGTSPVPLLANVGALVLLTVPAGAVQFQVGIDSAGNTFSANSGTFTVNWTLTTSAIATTISTLGDVTTYCWFDSPHSGGVASYLWKNPNDSGTGIPRSIGTADVTVTNNSWQFDSSPQNDTVPMLWDTLASDGTIIGSIPVFSVPAPVNAPNFDNFNMCVVGTIFVPAAGTYQFTFANKDQIMVGVGGGVTSSAGTPTGPLGQTISVVNSLPLVYVSVASGGGGTVFHTISLTFPGSGSYEVEIDYDFWFHSGRALYMLLGTFSSIPSPPTGTIPPLPQGVRTNVVYWAKYRSSITGARSNPSPASAPEVTPVLDNTIVAPYSPDPQVDKVDYYRQDAGLPNPTLVATGPNTNPPTPIVDSLSDLAAANNPTMDIDDFEPVPSIDLPRSGVVNVSGDVVTWVSGDHFNVRWLPGTIIEIGSPTQLAYSAVRRPGSTTLWDFNGSELAVVDGTNLVYNIAEPILAAQPLPNAFGPTDNITFAYALRDPLRPGTLYWSKGGNFDSWPDTNQQDVTDPNEPLVGGAMSSGLGVLGSIRRFWMILPNFFNAQATATGTSGSTWTLQDTSISRGLYMPYCIAVLGGGTAFFRVEDGVMAAAGGGAGKTITDETLYPLFSHEGSAIAPIARGGVTLIPPNDTIPGKQKFTVVGQFLYYDYQGTDGAMHTLTLDTEEGAWLYDNTTPVSTTHATFDGISSTGVLAGCLDGSVREMGQGAPEVIASTVVTAAIGGRGWQHISGFTMEYSSALPIMLTPVVVDQGNGSYAPAAVTLPATTGIPTKHFARFGPNKFKLMQFVFTWADPQAVVYLEGAEVDAKDWGSQAGYRQVPLLGSEGGFGGES